jgi:hypothetical protein
MKRAANKIKKSDKNTTEDLIDRYAIEYILLTRAKLFIIKWASTFFERCLCHLDNLNILICHCVFSRSEIVL